MFPFGLFGYSPRFNSTVIKATREVRFDRAKPNYIASNLEVSRIWNYQLLDQEYGIDLNRWFKFGEVEVRDWSNDV